MSRYANLAVGGFFSFPENILPHITKMFVNPHNGGRMLDNTAGEGVALQAISKALNLDAFAVELSAERAAKCIEKFGPRRAINDDAFKADITTNSMSLVWSNPPFSHDKYEETKRREYEFIRQNWRYLQGEGAYHVIACYTHHLTDKMTMSLALASDQIDIYRVPGFDLGAYMLIVIVARTTRTAFSQEDAGQRAMKMMQAGQHNYELNQAMRRGDLEIEDAEGLFPSIVDAPVGIYTLPKPHNIKKMMFKSSVRSHSMTLAAWKEMGPHLGQQYTESMAIVPSSEVVRPLIQPKRGQIPGLIAGGMFNGLDLDFVNVMDEEGNIYSDGKGRAVIRAVVRNEEVEVDVEEKGDELATTHTTVRIVPVAHIVLLYETGEIKELSGDVALASFVKANLVPLMDYAVKNFDPRYKFDFAEGKLAEFIHSRRLTKNGESSSLFATQKHYAAAAISTLWEDFDFTASASPGFGKTFFGAVVMDAFRHREKGDANYSLYQAIPMRKRMKPNQFNVVVCPPHLVMKWYNEIKGVDANAYVGAIMSGEGLNPMEETLAFIRGIDEQEPSTLKVLVISREMFKVADPALKDDESPWHGAVNFRNFRPEKNLDIIQIPIDPVTGVDAIERETKSGVKYYTVNRLNDSRIKVGNNARGLKKHRSGVIAKPEKDSYKKALLIEAGFANYGEVDMEDYERSKERNASWTEMRLKKAALRIRERRQREDKALKGETFALWQESRTSSSADHHTVIEEDGSTRRVSRGQLLARRMGTKKTDYVMPFPDVVTQHLTEGEFRAPKNPRGPFGGIARLLAQHYKHLIYMVLADEWHEYQDENSAQGKAMGRLVNAATKFLPMTGTLFGGKATSVYHMEYVTGRGDMRKKYPRIGGGKQKFAEEMGVLEFVITKKDVPAKSGRGTDRVITNSELREVPGASPALLKQLIGHTGFVDIRDLGKALPDFSEFGVPVEMDEEMRSVYASTDRALTNYLNDCRIDGDNSFLGSYFHALLDWPNNPYQPFDVWHRKTIVLPDDSEQKVEKIVWTIDGLGDDYVSAKELWLIDLINQELAAGRGVGVYVAQTGKGKGLQERIKALIQERCVLAKPVILTANVSTSKREAWIEKNKAANVLICNANLVKTGLDLLEFPTLVFFELFYSLYTMEQAKGRAYRAIQKRDCKVYYPFYVQELKDANTIAAGDVPEHLMSEWEIDGSTEYGQMTQAVLGDVMGMFTGGDMEATLTIGESDSETSYVADTMEARGIIVIDKKRQAAEFLYGSGGGSLSALSGGGGGSLYKELKKALESDEVQVIDSTTLFMKAAYESDWAVDEVGTVVTETSEEEVVEAAPVAAKVDIASKPRKAEKPLINIHPGKQWRGPAYNYMPSSIVSQIPAIGMASDEPIAYVKLFSSGRNTWYICEYDPETSLCAGWVMGQYDEVGQFTLADIAKNVRGQFGLPVERDTSFKPALLRDIIGDPSHKKSDVVVYSGIVHDEEEDGFELFVDLDEPEVVSPVEVEYFIAEEVFELIQSKTAMVDPHQRGTLREMDVYTTGGASLGKIVHEEFERLFVLVEQSRRKEAPILFESIVEVDEMEEFELMPVEVVAPVAPARVLTRNGNTATFKLSAKAAQHFNR